MESEIAVDDSEWGQRNAKVHPNIIGEQRLTFAGLVVTVHEFFAVLAYFPHHVGHHSRAVHRIVFVVGVIDAGVVDDFGVHRQDGW